MNHKEQFWHQLFKSLDDASDEDFLDFVENCEKTSDIPLVIPYLKFKTGDIENVKPRSV